MDLLAPVKRFDTFQQRHKGLSIPVAVVKKFGDDQAGNHASLIAYYAFFSLFPLLLAFVTVLGFVLQGDPGAQSSVANSVLGKFPMIGDQIRNHHLQGHAIALIIGIITSLLAGIGVTSTSGQAFDRVWAVPMKARPNFLQVRLQGIILLAVLGGLFLITSAASSLVSGVVGGPGTAVLGIVVSLLLNFGLFMAAFRLLGSTRVPWRTLLPGVIVAGILWEALQVLGTIYIKHFSKSSNTYGTFAVVIGVLAWLHLGAQMTLYAAEINVVLDRRLWPRSLFGPPDMPADEHALTALAKVEERSDQQTVEVRFTGTGTGDGDPPGTKSSGAASPANRER